MPRGAFATWMLSQEARALRTRLDRVRPIALQETMVPAAVPSASAIAAVEDFLARGRSELRGRIDEFLTWLDGPGGTAATPAEANRRFTFLRLRFNAVLTQLDIFAEAMSQRSEVETGVFLRGLEVAATDAMTLPGLFQPPPVLCYLARDAGGAIRRARTRLPGGGENPVALIRLPRERMVGSGVASSLVHEAGHQAADPLELVDGLRAHFAQPWGGTHVTSELRLLWWRWLSEIVADLWAIARIGVASTLGLISLVSLPRAFVLRVDRDDPHPGPWIRVRLSCAMGDALYPHPQWRRLAGLWSSYYPLGEARTPLTHLLESLDRSVPEFVARLLSFCAPRLGGRQLGVALRSPDRNPDRLTRTFDLWRKTPSLRDRVKPCLAFAVLGQARLDGVLSPESESNSVAALLRHWAFDTALAHARVCGAVSIPPRSIVLAGAKAVRAGVLMRR